MSFEILKETISFYLPVVIPFAVVIGMIYLLKKIKK